MIKIFLVLLQNCDELLEGAKALAKAAAPTSSPSTPIAIRNEKGQRPNDPTEESDPTEKIRAPTEKSMAAPQIPPNN
jgi:hypothetical protein